MPHRRDLLRGSAALGALAGLGLPYPACGASGVRVLKMGHVYTRRSQYGTGASAFARSIEAATGGAWQIDVYPSGILGGEIEMLDALRKGELDLAFVGTVTLASVVPEFGIFDLPFLFHDVDQARAVLDGPVGTAYLERCHARDLVALAWGETGMRHLTNARCPVHTPDDLRGLRLRVPQSDVTLRCFRQLGADVAKLGFPALYGALESGRFEGQENPIATIECGHLDRVQHYLSLTGHVYSGAIIFTSPDTWSVLSGAERAAFVEAAQAGGQASRLVADEGERKGVDRLRASGMEVVWSVDRAAFQAAMEPTWSDLAEQFGTAQIASLRASP